MFFFGNSFLQLNNNYRFSEPKVRGINCLQRYSNVFWSPVQRICPKNLLRHAGPLRLSLIKQRRMTFLWVCSKEALTPQSSPGREPCRGQWTHKSCHLVSALNKRVIEQVPNTGGTGQGGARE